MNKLDKTPLEFGLNFLSFDGIKLDSATKMRHVVKYSQNIDQSGKIKQLTSVIQIKILIILVILKIFKFLGYPNFVGPGIGSEKQRNMILISLKINSDQGSYIWKNIDGKKVSEFLLKILLFQHMSFIITM